MLDTYKRSIAQQYAAALCMLSAGIDRCPDDAWGAPVANLTFSQAAFHTLFYTDVYLGRNFASIADQPFHRAHPEPFADYNAIRGHDLQPHYGKPFVKAYLQHCRDKATAVVAAETEESLHSRADFDWQNLIRAELHVYNIRHVHHHAAQLSLRLRIDYGIDVPWVGSGWREV